MLKIKKIKPLFNRIVVTAERYTQNVTDHGLVVYTAGTLKEFQTVVEVGDSVRNIKVGDLVQIDPSRYAVKKYDDNSLKNDLGMNQTVSYNLPMIMLDDVQHMVLYDSDVEYIITDSEEIEDIVADQIIVTPKTIIN